MDRLEDAPLAGLGGVLTADAEPMLVVEASGDEEAVGNEGCA